MDEMVNRSNGPPKVLKHPLRLVVAAIMADGSEKESILRRV